MSDRRFLAAGVFAIASLLEVCGCNPLMSGGHSRLIGGAPTGVAAAARPCADCLSSSIAADALRSKLKIVEGVDSTGVTADRTSMAAAKLSSFDDPETPIEEPVDGPSTRSILSLDDKPGPWSIPESVFPVYKRVVAADGTVRRIPIATAFVISVPDLSHRMSVRFLVTARHVVDPEWARCSEQNPQSIDVRLNRRNGGFGYETIPLQKDHLPTFVAPSDGTADLALIRLDQHSIPNLDSYKFFDIHFRLLPTNSELWMVRADQQITTAGLLVRLSPEMSSYPISHGGVLSGNSTQEVTMQCDNAAALTQLHVWFIKAAIPRGVSGAPVFTTMNRGNAVTKTPVLLGVQAVAWPEQGVAGMTPSNVLSDLVQQALLRASKTMDFSKGPG